MTRFLIAFIIVAVILAGGLMTLLRNWRQPMGSPDALARAKQRNREIEAKERREADGD